MSQSAARVLALLALVGQLLAGALLVPAEAEAAQRASIRALAVLCAPAPARSPAHRHTLPDAPAKAVCLLAAQAVAVALPARPAPFAARGTFAPSTALRHAPSARGPPPILARRAAPRAPPLGT